MYSVDTLYQLEIGETFRFGGAPGQRVGDIVSLYEHGATYGFAKIIGIDAEGNKTARRVR